MEIVPWKDKYSVGSDELDTQHKKIFELLNRLYSNYHYRRPSFEIEDTFQELLSYVDYHFCLEEDIMRKADYPDLGRHIEAHKKITTRLNFMLETSKDQPELTVIRDLMIYLSEWVTNHILIHDKDYAPFINPGSGADC